MVKLLKFTVVKTYNNSTQYAPSGLGPRLRSAAGAGR